jgi:hypothetical protein
MKKIKLDENLSKDEIEKLYQETIDWCEENTPLKTRVTNKFLEIFDEIEERVYESRIKREELENKKYDLENVIKELEKIFLRMMKKKKINEDIDLMKSEIDFTKT